MKLSEKIREPAKRIGGPVRSCSVQWFNERADEAKALEAENETLKEYILEEVGAEHVLKEWGGELT